MKPKHGNDAIYRIWLECEADVILSLEPIANHLCTERGESYIKSEYFLFPLAVEMSSMHNSLSWGKGEKNPSLKIHPYFISEHTTVVFIFETVRYQDEELLTVQGMRIQVRD